MSLLVITRASNSFTFAAICLPSYSLCSHKTVANSKAQSSEFRQPVENSLTILSPQMCRAMEWKSSIIFPTKHVNNILFAINNKK